MEAKDQNKGAADRLERLCLYLSRPFQKVRIIPVYTLTNMLPCVLSEHELFHCCPQVMPVETLNALRSSVRVPRPPLRAGGRDGREEKEVRIGIKDVQILKARRGRNNTGLVEREEERGNPQIWLLGERHACVGFCLFFLRNKDNGRRETWKQNFF